jgi:hypothetical protein
MLLALGIIVAFGSLCMWAMILMSDPSNTQDARDAAARVLMIGLPIAALFVIAWWFDW